MSDEPERVRAAAALVSQLVERAALDGSTRVDADVVGAALRGAGFDDPAPGAQAAFETGAVAAFAQERCFGHVEWAELEEHVADALLGLRSESGDDAVIVVDAPRGTDPDAVVQPLCQALEQAGGRMARTRADLLDAQLPVVAEADLVVVERADLLGLAGAAQLGGALRERARLVLVGDHSLPPAPGPGQVLNDVVTSGVVAVLAAPVIEGAGPLAELVGSLRVGALPPLDQAQRAVVVTPAVDPEGAVRRAGQLVTSSLPRVFGVQPTDTLVLAPRAAGLTGTEELRSSLAALGVGEVEVRTCAEAVGRSAEAIVLVLGAEAGGSLTRDLLTGAATEAGQHLSVVHQAGPALAEAVADRPHRARHTRLARLLAAGLP